MGSAAVGVSSGVAVAVGASSRMAAVAIGSTSVPVAAGVATGVLVVIDGMLGNLALRDDIRPGMMK
ncbi:uncharacterized protein MELLADRAFT_90742 [Melampsora larici-populina 98AG31]|uniref:Uncharacterized protein n=1 Tax=Melampsora larici-populina (strain 98AG31 / pathotype 3-4-7) TaxID=747676 RepID=F4R7B5_MELLP|nr:uncharacterized protein MELLADRAFT_90742 [Melampsora larici-populina 98AG31]EGG11814.1 hypothetical protein MELLADRAFT_90742 [Melampsora larici-populina 98AG31]